MKVILHFKHWTLNFFLYSFAFGEIKWWCAFTEHTTQKSITKSQSTSVSWYYLRLVNLILNAKNLCEKHREMYFYGKQKGEFFIFSQDCTQSWGGVTPNTFKNFCGSCYIIQFKPYVSSKMELFVTEIVNGWKLLLIVVT